MHPAPLLMFFDKEKLRPGVSGAEFINRFFGGAVPCAGFLFTSRIPASLPSA